MVLFSLIIHKILTLISTFALASSNSPYLSDHSSIRFKLLHSAEKSAYILGSDLLITSLLFILQYIQTKMYNICKEKIYRVRQSEREGGREREKNRERKREKKESNQTEPNNFFGYGLKIK